MQSLKTIQTLSKIGKILSTIVFVFCIVGFCLCVVGAVGAALGFDAVEIGDVTIKGILQESEILTKDVLLAVAAGGAVVCLAEAVLAKFAAHYFERELRDGTPFTYGGAKELQRLGILAICLPLAGEIIASVLCAIALAAASEPELPDLAYESSIGIGIMMLVMAQVCKYGASLAEGAKPED